MKTSKKNFSSFYNHIKYSLLLIVLVSFFFWPVIIKGLVPLPGDFVVGVYYPWLDYKWGYATGVPVKNPITTDVVSFTYPMQTLAIDILKQGEWPLWNPLILGGAPLLANFQSAPFSPTNIVYFIFNKIEAWSVQIILQHIFAALFVSLLLKRWKVSTEGSTIAGIIFAYAGFNLIWSQWNGHTLAASFIPALILFIDYFLTSGNLIFGIGFSFFLAFQILSGYPQVVLYSAIALGLYWLLNFSKSKKYITRSLILGLFGILGFGLSAFQILPGKELLSLSQRAVEPHPFEWAFLPWVKTITFLAPDYFGNHSTQNYWGPQDYTSNTGFVGVVGLVFSILSLVNIKNKKVRFLFLLSIISLILSFPTPISIWIWKSGFLGLQAASAHRALVLWNLGIACLAGIGFDYIWRSSFKYRVLSISIPLLLLGMFGVGTVVMYQNTLNDPELSIVRGIPKYYVGLRNLIFPFVILASISVITLLSSKLIKFKKLVFMIVLALTVSEMYRFGWKFTPFVSRDIVYPDTPVLSYLQKSDPPFRVTGSKVIPINLRMPYGLESIEGYDAIYPILSSEFISAINENKSGAAAKGRYATVDNDTSPLLDLANNKYYLTLKYDEKGNPSPSGSTPDKFKDPKYVKAFEDKTTVVFESKSALPRAFVSYEWEIKKGNSVIDSLIFQNTISRKIYLETDPGIVMPEVAGSSSVKFLNYGSQKSKLEVTNSKDGLLFISDTFFPGWRVFIDGSESQFIRANYAFRAVPIPAGNHIVEYKYEPESFYNGLKIAVFSLLIVMLAVFFKYKLNLKA